jgi:Domain of unknown function (DUF4157)
MQRAAIDETPTAAVPGVVNDVLRTPGKPLEPSSREFFEPRFAHDFSKVRVHSDSVAAESAAAVNALAYTVGNDIVFGSGQYQPQSSAGRSTLAHELAHVVQQGNPPKSDSVPLEIGKPNDSFEQEAHASAHSVVNGGKANVKSVASGSAFRRLQRQAAIDTHAGQFELTRHNKLGGPTFAPQAQYDVKIEFLLYEITDCSEIALTQDSVAKVRGTPAFASAADRARALTAAEGTEGVGIDRLSGSTSPFYGAQNTGGTGGNAHFGHHVPGGAPDRAWLTDAPGYDGASGRRTAGDLLSFAFETCAICSKGQDQGAYYGCVSWGYDIDATDKFTEAPFARVSRGTPSADFLASAKKWNAQTVPVATDDLPVPTHTTNNLQMTRAQLDAEIITLAAKLVVIAARRITGSTVGQENVAQLSFELKVLRDIRDAITFNENIFSLRYEVRQVQAAVGATVTGEWTYETIQKLKIWQAKEGLKTTGQLDAESIKRLNISRIGDFPEPTEQMRHTA